MYDLNPYLHQIDDVIAQGPYQDTWESLSSYCVPKWYQKAKFGIFIHWGIYSVPAFGNEWYSRNMYIQGSPEYEHHIRTYGRHTDFGYKDFLPLFRAGHFQADKWAELFRQAMYPCRQAFSFSLLPTAWQLRPFRRLSPFRDRRRLRRFRYFWIFSV